MSSHPSVKHINLRILPKNSLEHIHFVGTWFPGSQRICRPDFGMHDLSKCALPTNLVCQNAVKNLALPKLSLSKHRLSLFVYFYKIVFLFCQTPRARANLELTLFSPCNKRKNKLGLSCAKLSSA